MTFNPDSMRKGGDSTDSWETPQEFYDMLDAEFGFTLDPCSSHENAKCENYYTVEDNGLRRPWAGIVFVNPPFSQLSHKPWVRKCYQEAQRGATVVLLIPARTDTAYWHNWVLRAAELRFVRGRVSYVHPTTHERGAPNFGSVVAIFRPGCDGPPVVSTMGRRLEPAIQLELEGCGAL